MSGPEICAVCTKCQRVILAHEVKLRTRNGYQHAYHTNGPYPVQSSANLPRKDARTR